MIKCDLIIPCAPHHQVDAAQILNYLHTATQLAANEQIDLSFHLIIVLDGPSRTSAATFDILTSALGKNFTLISLSQNQGKGAAIKTALGQAQGKYSFYSDADLPYPATELIKMLQVLQTGADVVMGKRQNSYYVQLPRSRVLISKGFALLNRLFLGTACDTQGGLKGLNRSGRWIFRQALLNRYLFDLDALYRARFAHLRRQSIPIEIRPALQFKNYTWQNYLQELKAVAASYGHLLFWPCIIGLIALLCFITFRLGPHNEYYFGSFVFHDYAVNLPLIRSFSWGHNFPVEYPTYAGAPIRYHYLYFLLIGCMEKLGLPLDWAFNLPTIVGMFLLLFLLFQQSYRWFKSKLAAYLAVLFFLFPGHGQISDFIAHITREQAAKTWTSFWQNTNFLGNYPWESHTLVASCLWNLNAYLNQRHFIWALAFLLIVFRFFTSPAMAQPSCARPPSDAPWKTYLILIFLMGLLPLWHLPSLIALAFILLALLIIVPRAYRSLIVVGGGGLAAMLLVNFTIFKFLHPQFADHHWWHPFWMSSNWREWCLFWAHNLGWHLIFLPIGLIAAGRTRRYFLPAFFMFGAGNLIQFVDPIVNQHKLFCTATLWMVPFSAWGVVWSVQHFGRWLAQHHLPDRLPALFLLLFLTINLMRGGLFDLIPILRQKHYLFFEHPSDQATLLWIKNHTPPSAIFVSNHPTLNFPLLAGRRVFSNWPSYAAALRYPNVIARKDIVERAYTWPHRENQDFNFLQLCHLMHINHIDYAIFENPVFFVAGDQGFFDLARLRAQKTPDYGPEGGAAVIYSKQKVCAGLGSTPLPLE